jgi:ectoine hydroxylase-related dioxygenase (phytanoyl-CoA dioxygenase family)
MLAAGQAGVPCGFEATGLSSELSALRAGDCLVFDDRALHRGLANRSGAERWLAYFSYARPRDVSAVDETHFEATRSLFDVPDTLTAHEARLLIER